MNRYAMKSRVVSAIALALSLLVLIAAATVVRAEITYQETTESGTQITLFPYGFDFPDEYVMEVSEIPTEEIVEGINDGIQKLFQSEKYAEYLRTMSRFHNYSFNNTVLIHLQKPHASKCAGFRQWKERFGRHVKKGETGITIIAPTPFRKKIEEEKLDPDTQLPMRDPDGKIIMEEKTIEIPMFRPVKVFDVNVNKL